MNLFRSIFLIFFLLLMSGCSGNKSIQSLFAPDDDLKSTSAQNQTKDRNIDNNKTPPTEAKLPIDFPKDIPVYNSAKLVSIDKNATVWSSDDPLNLISNYYQQQLTKQEWDLITQNNNLITAQKPTENRILNISFVLENSQSKFTIKQEQKATLTQPNNTKKPNSNKDLNSELPASLQQLISLNIITQDEQLTPYQTITRREYAQLLVKANNALYSNVNSKLIRLVNPDSKPKPIFTDVPPEDPDFAVIQGLAEAGLIPSSLTQDPTAIAFNPDKPLTREDLVTWKVPLDSRQKLPNTTLDNIKETWGFQDATKIKPSAWAGLYVDWQNGENSNIRKAFGYITLFQPQKPVTYQEAAEVLSSFGYQGDVVFLKELNQQ